MDDLVAEILSTVAEIIVEILTNFDPSMLLSKMIQNFVIGAMDALTGILLDGVNVVMNSMTYMEEYTGTTFSDLFGILYSYGILLIILKFVWKGFNTYVLWSDGDPDADPMQLIINFCKAMVVAICFGEIYSYLVKIVTELSEDVLSNVNLNVSVSSGSDLFSQIDMASMTLFTGILILLFAIICLLMVLQMIKKGIEMLLLRLGVPLVCSGMLDSDGGIFKPFAKKFIQISATIIVQVMLIKLSFVVLLANHLIWGLGILLMAYSTPSFLNEFLMVNQGGGISSKLYTASMVKNMVTKK